MKHKLSKAGMPGRFKLKHRMCFDVIKGLGVRGNLGGQFRRALAAHLRMAKDGFNSRVACRTGKAVFLPMDQIPDCAALCVKRVGVLHKRRINRGLRNPVQEASNAAMIGENASSVRLAPPTSAPSTLDTAKISAALEPLTEPP